MTVDGSAQSGAVWPAPKFYFRVVIDDVEMLFQEISGLEFDNHPSKHVAEHSKRLSPVKMPEMLRTGYVTMKKGVLAKDEGLYDWFAQINMNTIERKSVTISLLDETDNPTMVWKLQNDFPAKIKGTDLKAEGNEVAVETIELAHEGIVLVKT